MKSTMSRRAFLKGGLAAAAGAAAAAVPGARALAATADDSGYLATLIDIRKCIGCESCVEACREANASKFPDPASRSPRCTRPG